MKNLIISAILALCVSCAYSEKVKEVKNNNASAFKLNGNVQFSDSCIVLDPGSSAELKDNYKNFELSFECKTGEGTVGSVFFHTKNGDLATGYEVIISNDISPDEWWKTGGLSAIRNFGKRTCNNGNWEMIRVAVVGKQIKTYSNGVPIVDYTEPGEPYREAKYASRLLSEGHFVFNCNKGQPLQIRNVKITRFPNDSLNTSYAVNEQTDDIIKLHQRYFPTIDYHIHAKGGLSTERAEYIARVNGITYAVAPNCGMDFSIKNDEQLLQWLANNKHKPFLMPMQAEGREWTGMFSREAISQFDYVFTDALTWSDSKGRRLRLWIPSDTFVDDEQQFMNELTNVICKILETEPIDVFANPTYLPEILVNDYDRLWTEERMLRVIDAAVKNNIALELNNLNRIPSLKFVKMAKQRGVKFTFGTNNANEEQLGKMEYLIKAIDECGLTASDMFIPTSKNF